MRIFAFLFFLFVYLCPIRAQIDSIRIINHDTISIISSKGYWNATYGVAFPAFSVSIYNRYKRLSYTQYSIEVKYRAKDSLSLSFPISRSKDSIPSKIHEFKVHTIDREEFLVEGVSRKTMDRRYRNRMLLYLDGGNAQGEALLNRHTNKHSYKILEPLIGTKHANSVLQDSSFFEVTEGKIVDVLFDKGPYYVNDSLPRKAVYQLSFPKGWKRIAYSTGEIMIIYPRGGLIMVMPKYTEPDTDWGEGPFIAEQVSFYESRKIPYPIRETLRKNEKICSVAGHYGNGQINVVIRNRNKKIERILETICSGRNFLETQTEPSNGME